MNIPANTKAAIDYVTGLGLVSKDDRSGEVTDAKRTSEVESILVPVIMTMMLFLMMMGLMFLF